MSRLWCMNSAEGATRFLSTLLFHKKIPSTASKRMMRPPITPPAMGPALLRPLELLASEGVEGDDELRVGTDCVEVADERAEEIASVAEDGPTTSDRAAVPFEV